MASAGVPEAEGARETHGLPRDHQVGDRPCGGQPARHRLRNGRRGRDAEDPRPPVRLRGLAGAVAPRQSRPLGGTRPVPHGPPDRGAGTRAHRVRHRGLLGHRRRHRQRPGLRCEADLACRRTHRERQGFRQCRPRQGRGRGTRRAPHPRSRGEPGRLDVHRPIGRGEALQVVAEGSFHDLDPPTGGRPQAPAVVVAGDARRTGALRAWLHHVHANRQRGSLRRGDERDACSDHQRVRIEVPERRAEAVQDEVEERGRRRTRRSARPRRTARPTRWPPS